MTGLDAGIKFFMVFFEGKMILFQVYPFVGKDF